MTRLARYPLLVLAVLLALVAYPAAAQAAPARPGSPHRGRGAPSPAGPGRPASPLPQPAPSPSASQGTTALTPEGLPSGGLQTAAASTAAAARKAAATGTPVTVPALTTGTTTVTAAPGGRFTLTEHVLPVRVRRGGGWVPVDTTLTRTAGGTLRAAAVPGDTVTLSGGGSGPLATIAAAGARFGVSWTGALPAPAVSGSSATYRNVLPGVDLVVTVTSVQAGGFSEVLVVHNAAAARDPGLRSLTLGVAGTALHPAAGGALAAPAASGAGAFIAPAPLMWDSSQAAPGSAAAAALAAAARKAGGFTAAPGAAAASSAAGPASGAQVAPVKTSVGAAGRTLALVPDAALLAAPATRFPVYIDPSFSWHKKNGSRQHYDEVQSACPSASHYDTSLSAYWSLGVGYDGWGDCNGKNGYAYSYYQVAVPSAIWGGHLYSASVKAQEAYTASCSAKANVTLSRTGKISSSTDWSNKPGVISNLATDYVGPNGSSCNNTVDKSSSAWKGVGFNVLGTMKTAASQHWSNFTFRLWEQNNSNDVDWKRFGHNPYVQIQYNQSPGTPSGLTISTGGSGADCLSSPYPWIGKLSSGGTTMAAKVSDKDGDQLAARFKYWVNGSSSTTTVTSANVSSGSTASQTVPASFTNGLADGTEVDWQAQAFDGAPSSYGPNSSWSATCHFYVDPTSPAPPAVSANFSASPAAGQNASFTITAASGDTPTEFVWGLDKQPPTANPKSAQVVKLASGQTSATVTVPVPGPGPHALYAYTTDAAGNVSQMSGASDPATFTATGDPNLAYPSFANALAAGKPFDNTMVATSTSNSGSADADGYGNSISLTEMKNAGWQPGGKVTVDGATFTLPDFGTGSPDNLLAANQTIGLPASSQGTSLVILATAADADASSLDAATMQSLSDNTAPYLAAGSPVAGYECYGYQASQGTCTVPSGTITYTSASGASPERYYLSVPDWTQGPAGPAAFGMPDRSTSSGSQAHPPKLYAFSIPLQPSAQVASVTLPDVGSVLTVGGHGYPSLHILGIATANTTTATPGSAALPSGQAWTGTWASPSEEVAAPPSADGSAFTSQTFRITMRASAGGSAVRLRLSDDLGWLAGASGGPLDIGHVTVAQQGTGAALTGTVQTADFGGSQSVTIPEGGDVYSDPVPITVSADESLSVSIYLSNKVPDLVEHRWCTDCTSYVTAAGSGDQTANTSGSPYSGTGTRDAQFSDILTGVDVQTAGVPTAVVLGNNLIDATFSGTTPVALASRVSDDLAQAEISAGGGPGGGPAFGVVGAGIQSNDIVADQDTGTGVTGGPSALSRLADDVLAEPGAGTVVVDQGLADLLQAQGSATAETDLTDTGYPELAGQLQAWGITVVFATLTPCSGFTGSGRSPSDACTATVDGHRTDINGSYLPSQYGGMPAPCLLAPCTFVDDFSAAVGNSASPQALQSADDSGDHVNLTGGGYAAAAATVAPAQLTPASPPGY